jgi:hypothetical protein
MRLFRILRVRTVGLMAMALLLFSPHGSIPTTTAETQIKWTAASNTAASEKNDPARTAPKSQRYWDEHQIPRPDYAKTDAEIAAERMDRILGGPVQNFVNKIGTLQFYFLMLALLVGVGLLLAYSSRLSFIGSATAGNRLGGSGSSGFRFFHGTTAAATTTTTKNSVVSATTKEEQTRLARLARFEANDDDKSKKE